MAKMIDFVTVTRGILPYNAAQIAADLKAKYIDNGWELFNTHYMNQVNEEVHMIYVFVKYEQEPPSLLGKPAVYADLVGGDTVYTPSLDEDGNVVTLTETDAEAPRRRGRPRKVEVSA